MNTVKVMVVRIYFTENSDLLKPIISYLTNEAKIRGVSVFRAISGHGESGEHTSSLIDLCLDLPLIIEFFDHPTEVKNTLDYINTLIKPEHVIFWEAEANSAVL